MSLIVVLFLISQWLILGPNPSQPTTGSEVNFQVLMAQSGYRALLRHLSLIGAITSLIIVGFGLGYIWTRAKLAAIWKVLGMLIVVLAVIWTLFFWVLAAAFPPRGTDLTPVKTIQNNTNRYHLVHMTVSYGGDDGGYRAYALYKCNMTDLACNSVYLVSDWGGPNALNQTLPPAELLTDDSGIRLVIGDEVAYVVPQ